MKTVRCGQNPAGIPTRRTPMATTRFTDETLWDDHAGTWFGLTTEGWTVDVQDELCALPYDTYTLEELPCEGNQGYELVKIPNITISRNNTVIELGTIDDQYEGVPEIGTTATVDGEHTAEPAGEVTIIDTVSYKNLKVGQTYKLSGVLMDKSYWRALAGERAAGHSGAGVYPRFCRWDRGINLHFRCLCLGGQIRGSFRGSVPG